MIKVICEWLTPKGREPMCYTLRITVEVDGRIKGGWLNAVDRYADGKGRFFGSFQPLAALLPNAKLSEYEAAKAGVLGFVSDLPATLDLPFRKVVYESQPPVESPSPPRRPHVCPTCEGFGAQGCPTCGGSGMVEPPPVDPPEPPAVP